MFFLLLWLIFLCFQCFSSSIQLTGSLVWMERNASSFHSLGFSVVLMLCLSQVSKSACILTTQAIMKLLKSKEAATAVDIKTWPTILDTGIECSPASQNVNSLKLDLFILLYYNCLIESMFLALHWHSCPETAESINTVKIQFCPVLFCQNNNMVPFSFYIF